eukprot:Blabericola_migrator_1__13242@NODE_91_length_14555_cov_140_209277_g81_i0_p16_GENE_NODE_91_length_14555_cov_140_209277_g81_i0NODE_91_length_14555_cov_140_209277_g81_i0_p16_ORF_typecomplete_len125_score8_66Cu_amine_oxid/PF01179_20/0_084_NODE_91_length_14555_cov_140_209277_g81_i01378214156
MFNTLGTSRFTWLSRIKPQNNARTVVNIKANHNVSRRTEWDFRRRGSISGVNRLTAYINMRGCRSQHVSSPAPYIVSAKIHSHIFNIGNVALRMRRHAGVGTPGPQVDGEVCRCGICRISRTAL